MKKKESNRVSQAMKIHQTCNAVKDKKRESDHRYLQRKKTEKQLFQDELLYWKNKAIQLQKQVDKLMGIEEESEKDQYLESSHTSRYDKCEKIQEEPEGENSEPLKDEKMKEIIDSYLSDEGNTLTLTQYTIAEFTKLVDEIRPTFLDTTWHGSI